jgi:hypothetical protein
VLSSRIYVIGLLFVLAGCATTPTPTNSAKPVPNERVLESALFHRNSPKDVEVIVKRDQGLNGALNDTILTVDGKEVAKLQPGEIARLYLPSGRYLLGVVPSSNPFGSHSLQEIEASVSAETLQIYRIQTGSGDDFAFRIARSSY